MSDALASKVLVLNRHWIVIHVTTARRALCLLFSGYAKVVDEDYNTYDFESWRDLSELNELEEATGPSINTPNFSMMVPEVIQLLHFAKHPPRRVKFSRRNIFLRDQHMCQYCSVKPPVSELTIDHVLPRAQGGRSTWDNVVVACMKCNTKKGNRTPEQANMAMKTTPKRPNWLAAAFIGAGRHLRPSWERFIDRAYWDVSLKE